MIIDIVVKSLSHITSILMYVHTLVCVPDTVYTVIFEGRKFREFCCKLAEYKILIFEKKH